MKLKFSFQIFLRIVFPILCVLDRIGRQMSMGRVQFGEQEIYVRVLQIFSFINICSFLVFIVILFIYLRTIMKKYHDYQFKENDKPMTYCFIQMVSVLSGIIIYTVYDAFYSTISGQSIHASMNFCQSSSTRFLIYYLFHIPGYEFKLIHIIICYVIIVEKGSLDIL